MQYVLLAERQPSVCRGADMPRRRPGPSQLRDTNAAHKGGKSFRADARTLFIVMLQASGRAL